MAYKINNKQVYKPTKTSKSFFEEVGKKEGLEGNQLRDFVNFMQLRFPHEKDYTYTAEWVGRFKDGREWWSADGDSKKALMKINPVYYKRFLQDIEIEKKRFKKQQGFEDISIQFTSNLVNKSKYSR